jgi:redox-sensitive bicupin YhaK (pirin superfamily)
MSAGSGVMHSEFNHSPDHTTHFLQIWIEPNVRGIAPSYEEKRFDASEKRGRLRLIASPDGADSSVTIHQDARLYAGLFDNNESAVHRLAPGRSAYLHVVRGAVAVNDAALAAGDAAMVRDEAELRLANGHAAEVLLFDLQQHP